MCICVYLCVCMCRDRPLDIHSLDCVSACTCENIHTNSHTHNAYAFMRASAQKHALHVHTRVECVNINMYIHSTCILPASKSSSSWDPRSGAGCWTRHAQGLVHARRGFLPGLVHTRSLPELLLHLYSRMVDRNVFSAYLFFFFSMWEVVRQLSNGGFSFQW